MIALLGIGVLSAPLGESAPLLSLLALLGSTVCFAQAAVVVRRFPDGHPITMNAVGMATAAVLLVAGSLFAGESIVLPEQAETWAALVYLIAIGSIVVFGLYVFVLRHWSASRAAYTFVLVRREPAS